jgi:hypothetical protein
MEFRVWTELIQQSRGALHVFLPLLDRGLDAVIHRLTDGEYTPVRVKGRAATDKSDVEITIQGSRLVDDRALLIARLLTDEGIGTMLLVVDEGTFKQLATHQLVRGEEIYWAIFSMDPATSRWGQFMVPRERLAERLLGTTPPSPAEPAMAESGVEPIDRHNQWLGFLGEAEVVRRLAENPRLDLFRPFPDLEMVEVLVRDNVKGRFVGLQVKTSVPARYGEAHFRVRKATFVAAPTTWIAGLAWIEERARFSDECLLMPTEELIRIAGDGGDTWVLNFNPEKPERTPVDPYRLRLANLGEFIGQVTSIV